MRLKQPLGSVGEVFQVIGTPKRVAELTGSDINAVYRWKNFGRFPWRAQLPLTRELERLGHRASDDLWGMRK